MQFVLGRIQFDGVFHRYVIGTVDGRNAVESLRNGKNIPDIDIQQATPCGNQRRIQLVDVVIRRRSRIEYKARRRVIQPDYLVLAQILQGDNIPDIFGLCTSVGFPDFDTGDACRTVDKRIIFDGIVIVFTEILC